MVQIHQHARLVQADEEPPSGDGSVRLLLRRRADVKIRNALQICSLRLAGLAHEGIRIRLGLTVDEYRRARRWLRDAVARTVASREPISIEDALKERGAESVACAIRVGTMRLEGRSRGEIQRLLRLTDSSYDQAVEWLRDAISSTPRDE